MELLIESDFVAILNCEILPHPHSRAALMLLLSEFPFIAFVIPKVGGIPKRSESLEHSCPL